MQKRFYIGEGPEAAAIAAEILKGKAVEREGSARLLAFAKELGFSDVWSCRSLGTTRVGGVVSAEKLSTDEEKARGVKLYSRMSDGSGWAYSPRRNVKAGKDLARMVEEANKSIFDASWFIVTRTGMAQDVCERGCLRFAVAACIEERILVKVPVGERKNAPTPPTWLRECKESEFLAALGQ